MSVITFLKSLFNKRKVHIESIKQIEKEIAEVIHKSEPEPIEEAPKVVKPKKAKPKAKPKKKPAKKKTNESK